jgi:hypothetical protein
MNTQSVREAAERLIHEVNLYVAEHGNPLVAPNIQTDMFTVAQAVLSLLAERGTYALALEQIRSAPLARESSIDRYKRCRDTANEALNKYADKRR